MKLHKKRITHKLGFGRGRILEQSGTATYVPAGLSGPAFTIRISDVDGFAFSTEGLVHGDLTIYGRGTTLAHLDTDPFTARRIEEWFRAHRDFQTHRKATA